MVQALTFASRKFLLLFTFEHEPKCHRGYFVTVVNVNTFGPPVLFSPYVLLKCILVMGEQYTMRPPKSLVYQTHFRWRGFCHIAQRREMPLKFYPITAPPFP